MFRFVIGVLLAIAGSYAFVSASFPFRRWSGTVLFAVGVLLMFVSEADRIASSFLLVSILVIAYVLRARQPRPPEGEDGEGEPEFDEVESG